MVVRLSTTRFGTLAELDPRSPLGDERLHPEERAVAAGFEGVRRATFVGGRAALRRALEALGAAAGPILNDERGAPVLPHALRGSIAHKETVAVALAVRAEDALHVGTGVDVEYDRPGRVDISRRVLTAEELDRLALFQEVERERAVRVAFAVKEAIYKAIHPACRRYVGFREVALELATPLVPGDVRVTCALDPDPGPLAVEAAWCVSEDTAGEPLVIAMARATREK